MSVDTEARDLQLEGADADEVGEYMKSSLQGRCQQAAFAAVDPRKKHASGVINVIKIVGYVVVGLFAVLVILVAPQLFGALTNVAGDSGGSFLGFGGGEAAPATEVVDAPEGQADPIESTEADEETDFGSMFDNENEGLDQ